MNWKKVAPFGILFLLIDFLISYYIIVIQSPKTNTIVKLSNPSKIQPTPTIKDNIIIGNYSYAKEDFAQNPNDQPNLNKDILFLRIDFPKNLTDKNFPETESISYQKINNYYDQIKNQKMSMLQAKELLVKEIPNKDITITTSVQTVSNKGKNTLPNLNLFTEIGSLVLNEVSRIYYIQDTNTNYYIFGQVTKIVKI